MKNLFSNFPLNSPEELADKLSGNRTVRIERIVSAGHASPPGFWYDQPEHEWVVVLKGEAELVLQGAGDDADRSLRMKPGDCVDIPAHHKHRVEWTTPDEPTVWLAVFYGDDAPNDSAAN